jgi:hypothetical protein
MPCCPGNYSRLSTRGPLQTPAEHMQARPRVYPLRLKFGADTNLDKRIRTHLEREQTIAWLRNGGCICALADLRAGAVHSNPNTPHTQPLLLKPGT